MLLTEFDYQQQLECGFELKEGLLLPSPGAD